MNNKGFIVVEANQYWTDEMMLTVEGGQPLRFFESIELAENYRQSLEIKKWKSLLSGQVPELEGLDYEHPERDTYNISYQGKETIYKVENQLFWIINYYTMLTYDCSFLGIEKNMLSCKSFLDIEAKLKEKGFDLKPEMSEEGIITFINICENLIDDFPKFYLVQEVELIED